MSTTKGQTISRVRNLVKAAKADAFLTDRLIYSLVLKYAKLFIKRLDDQNKVILYNSLFQKLPGVELVEVDKIEACVSLDTCCTIRRTKDRLPTVLEGSRGSIIRSVTSIDGSKILYETYAQTYSNMTQTTSFKYNKNIYYWIIDGYAFFPNVEWEIIDIEAMWEDDIEMYKCDAGECPVSKLDEKSNIPDSLFPDIENGVRQELLGLLSIPNEAKEDNQSFLKS